MATVNGGVVSGSQGLSAPSLLSVICPPTTRGFWVDVALTEMTINYISSWGEGKLGRREPYYIISELRENQDRIAFKRESFG